MNLESISMTADIFLVFYVGMLLTLQKTNVRSLWFRAMTIIIVLGLPLSTIFPFAEGFQTGGQFLLFVTFGLGAVLGSMPIILTDNKEHRTFLRNVMVGLAFNGILVAMCVNGLTSMAWDFGFYAKCAATVVFSFFAVQAYLGGYKHMKLNNELGIYITATLVMYVVMAYAMLSVSF